MNFSISVFTVDMNATSETLSEILNWFQDGNNVAVSKINLARTYVFSCSKFKIYSQKFEPPLKQNLFEFDFLVKFLILTISRYSMECI